MVGRKPGTRNKHHTDRTDQITLKIRPSLKNEWKAACARLGVKMSDRLEYFVEQELAIDGAFGVEQESSQP